TITDSNGCKMADTIAITQPIAIKDSMSSTVALCSKADGSASVTAKNGSAPYSYLWSPSTQTSTTASNLAPGVYTVTITDKNGCIKTDTITVHGTAPPKATITGPFKICTGDSVVLSATGGGTYKWNTGATTSSITVKPSATTNYTV